MLPKANGVSPFLRFDLDSEEAHVTVTPKHERRVSAERALFVAANRELVTKIVNEERRKFEAEHGSAWHVTDDDLVQSGYVGFLEAASVYRDGPLSLTSFAHPWIRKAVWKGLDDGRRLGVPYDFDSLDEAA